MFNQFKPIFWISAIIGIITALLLTWMDFQVDNRFILLIGNTIVSCLLLVASIQNSFPNGKVSNKSFPIDMSLNTLCGINLTLSILLWILYTSDASYRVLSLISGIQALGLVVLIPVLLMLSNKARNEIEITQQRS